MKEFRRRSDGRVMSDKDFRNSFPDASFPAVLGQTELDSLGFDPVLEHPAPTPPRGYYVERDGATQDVIFGNWIYNWKVTKLPDSAIATNLASDQTVMWDRIQVERDRREAGGVKVGEYWFHTDTPSMLKYLAMMAAGAALPSNINWKTMGGVKVPMTPELIMQVYMTCMAVNNQIFEAGEAHKAAMLAAEDPLKYNYETPGSWPLIYGETPPVVPPAVYPA